MLERINQLGVESFISAAEVDGLNLVRLMIGTSQNTVPNPECINQLSQAARSFYDNYYPNGYFKRIQDRAVVSGITRHKDGLREALIEDLKLPDKSLDGLTAEADESEIRQAIKMPEKYGGLRLLPPYRSLDWGEPMKYWDLKVMIGREGLRPDKIWFRNDRNRSFFVASADGPDDLEGMFSSQYYGRRKVTGVIFEPELDLKSEIVLFDIDGTLRKYGDETSTRPKGIACLKALDKRGIKMGVWSRNELEAVNSFADNVQKDAAVQIYPRIAFDNWPFINFEGRYLKPKPDSVKVIIDKMLKEKAGLLSNSGIDEILIKRIAAQVGKTVVPDFDDQEGLEAKAPLIAGLGLDTIDESIAESLVKAGVLVNDNFYSLGSAFFLGYSFIHLNSPESLDKVPDLV